MNSIVKRRAKKRHSQNEIAREMLDIRQKLERLTLFDDGLSSAERMADCEEHFFHFCKGYFPHYFSSTTQAEFHQALVDLAMIEETPGVAACPRGFAKSTIVSFAFVLYCICYQKKRFVVICMETYEKAEMQVWRILLELQLNRRLINDFGLIVSKDAAHGDFTTILSGDRKTSTRVLALGAGQSARGLINSQYRPDLFICDDMESRELARNPKRVAKLIELILSDYLGCMCAEGWTFLVYGTIICVDSALYQLMNDEEIARHFNRLHTRAIEVDGNGTEYSTWEEVQPIVKLQQLREIMKTKFAAEKQNEPMEEEGKFRQSWFGYWDGLPVTFNMRKLILQLDPSYSATGDNKAMVVGGRYFHTNKCPDFGRWRLSNGTILPEDDYTIIVEIFNRKCSIDEMILKVYELFDRYKPEMIYIDGTYAQKIIFEREFGRYAAQRGRLPIKYIDWRESKDSRILALEGPVERKQILFPKPDTPDVRTTVQQFVRYGETGVNDDGPDVVAALDERLKPKKRAAKLFV